MRVRQLIRPDIMVSAIAHLSVLALIFVFAEVRRFNQVATAPIVVDLVTPEEIENKPQPEPEPTPQLPSSQAMPSPETTASPPPAASRQAAEAAPPKQAPRPDRNEAAAEPKLEPQQPPLSPAPSPPSSANYTPPEPDLTVKYHVMLGLPEDTPLQAGEATSSRDVPGDGIDATASSEADLSSSIIAQFRRHL